MYCGYCALDSRHKVNHYTLSVDVPRGRRGLRGVGGVERRAGVVRAARRRAGVGPARAGGPPPGAGAPRAHQVCRAFAEGGPLRYRSRRRRYQGTVGFVVTGSSAGLSRVQYITLA